VCHRLTHREQAMEAARYATKQHGQEFFGRTRLDTVRKQGVKLLAVVRAEIGEPAMQATERTAVGRQHEGAGVARAQPLDRSQEISGSASGADESTLTLGEIVGST
jgi:hypothetical protein